MARAFPLLVALWLTLMGVAGALPAVFALLVARLVQRLPVVVGDGFGSPAGKDLQWTLGGMAAVLVANALVSAARLVVQGDLYRRYEEYLLARVMAATLSAPDLALFENPASAGRLERIAGLAWWEPGDLVDGLGEKWSARIQGLASAVLVTLVWPVAGVLLGIVWVLVGRRLEADYRLLDAEGQGSLPMRRATYLKSLALMPAWAKELRIFGLSGWVTAGFRRDRGVVIDQLAAARNVGRRDRIVLLTAVIAGNVAVLLWAAHAAISGSMSTGAITVLVQGLVGMGMLADQEGDLLIGWGANHVPRVMELEKSATATGGRPAGTQPPPAHIEQDIRFEQVGFTYPGRDTPVYADLDLTIAAGQSLAIVGLNGAGKTTLAKLLTGLETPQTGRITIDGIDLRQIDPVSWHRNVAAIFQDFVHYQLSAADNIGFGAIGELHEPDARRQARQAAERAGAEQLIAGLPAGLDTPLSAAVAGGVDLSGGQWQPIALARAMRAVQAGAQVLILDEPTAQLDVRAEADVYDRFLDLTRGLTTIVISHRFSTVRRADRIVVLGGGRISEDGSHEDLLAVNGTYARLFRKQAQRYTDTEEAPHE